MYKFIQHFLFFCIFSIGFLLFYPVCYAAGENCIYLFDDFSGTSGIDWSANFGNWTVSDQKIETNVTTDVMYAYSGSLLPEKTFIIDTDVEWLTGAHIDSAYGIFP